MVSPPPYFMGGPATSILPYAAGTLTVDLLVILPIGICYWNRLCTD